MKVIALFQAAISRVHAFVLCCLLISRFSMADLLKDPHHWLGPPLPQSLRQGARHAPVEAGTLRVPVTCCTAVDIQQPNGSNVVKSLLYNKIR